ncbi:hypothetical protein AAX26_01651 [Aliarcobacter thereius]|uniref:VirB3 family type IV secretion system protein n=1 Tax=Aliarcobacter thereius TaxID=544718 RepID=UPI0008279275|nr:VirB3 family type IV secretion system protein [Aliarcobacter thereius]OCL86001.1 hypothetical protein AAX26_01651 [Aliarcobacter thereius]
MIEENIKIENNRVLSSPVLVRGIPRIGWLLNVILTAIPLNIFGVFAAVPTFIVLYILLYLYSKRDPDFLNINIIKNIKINATKQKYFKGNMYVS